MSIESNVRGGFKAKKPNLPWYKRCPADWQKGTRKHAMSFELRGFYSECLDVMWELQGALPKDSKKLAMLLGSNPRQVRALMLKLIELGKMVETATGYFNPRMMADIGAETEAPIEVEPTSNRPPIDLQSRSKIGKSPTITTRETESESDIDSEPNKSSSVQLAARSGGADDWRGRSNELFETLAKHANGSLYPLALGLQTVSEPIAWLAGGADLELDVLPVLEAAGHRAKPQSVRSWSYFAPMVAEAKARRERGLPPARAGGEQPAKPKSRFSELLDAALAEGAPA